MAKLPAKQLTLTVHSPEYPDVVVRSKEEGEVLLYIENKGFAPRNLTSDHPGYKLWTWKTKRDGDLSVMLGFSRD